MQSLPLRFDFLIVMLFFNLFGTAHSHASPKDLPVVFAGHWSGLGTLIQNGSHSSPCQQSELWIERDSGSLKFLEALFQCRPHFFDFHSVHLEAREGELFLDGLKVGTLEADCLEITLGSSGNSWSLKLCKEKNSLSYLDRLEAFGNSYQIQAVLDPVPDLALFRNF